ncbi:MAG: endonuclease [Myxococcota bacterium]
MPPMPKLTGRRDLTTRRPESAFRGQISGQGPSTVRQAKPQRGGFAKTDTLANARAQQPSSDPFSGLRDQALIRAIRGAVLAKKQVIDYPVVRHLIFTLIDNVDGEVECVYTGRKLPGGKIPDDEDMNLEHVWPQSRGAKGEAKRDMHNILVADSEANNKRGNTPFGIVKTLLWTKAGSVLGLDADGQECFTPRAQVRGDVARCIFYFASVYGFKVDAKEEAALRAWDKADPVDAHELERNKRIQREQGNPNYYVLYSQLIDRIGDL